MGSGTILVTGGMGYIGSRCVLDLLEHGYDVGVFDNLSTGHVEFDRVMRNQRGLEGEYLGLEAGDLLDPGDVDEAFRRFKPSAVVHFAAFSQVSESVRDPGKYYRNNVAGTVGLLDGMRRSGVDRIVFSSTAAVYGEPEYTPIDEDHPRNPINPYGATKLMIERIMDDYGNAYGLRSVRLRYFNVAGADSEGRVGEWHEPETHLIPNVLRGATGESAAFRMFGTDYGTRDGTCVRDYVNVEDLADAHLLALEYLEDGGRTDVFNLGTEEGSTVREVFAECEKVVGHSIPVIEEGRRPGDPAVLVADSRKAREVLGWEPRRTLSESLRTAYAWENRRRALFPDDAASSLRDPQSKKI